LRDGLSTAEAARRVPPRAEQPSAPPRPAWRRLLAQFHDPLVYLLLGAVAVALAAWPSKAGTAGRSTRSWSRSSSC
jgi:hypothetical protein